MNRIPTSAYSYEAYVFQVHCITNPDGAMIGLQSFHQDSSVAATELTRLQNRSIQETADQLYRQLSFTGALAMRELTMSTNSRELAASEQAMDKLSTHLGVIGSLAVEQLIEPELYQKNPALLRLQNPFQDTDLLRFIVRHHADKRLRAGSKDIMTLRRLAPGYTT